MNGLSVVQVQTVKQRTPLYPLLRLCNTGAVLGFVVQRYWSMYCLHFIVLWLFIICVLQVIHSECEWVFSCLPMDAKDLFGFLLNIAPASDVQAISSSLNLIITAGRGSGAPVRWVCCHWGIFPLILPRHRILHVFSLPSLRHDGISNTPVGHLPRRLWQRSLLQSFSLWPFGSFSRTPDRPEIVEVSWRSASRLGGDCSVIMAPSFSTKSELRSQPQIFECCSPKSVLPIFSFLKRQFVYVLL